MAAITQRRLFTIWFWMSAPILIGGLAIAFASCVWFGLLASVLAAVWFWETGETTCSRCPSYGTFRCGVPGKLVPLFWKRKSAASVSPSRIRLHFYFDVFLLLCVNATYILHPWLLPLALIWTAGAWWISLGPKRYHGLLHRLKEPDKAGSRRVSLPMVGLPSASEAVIRERPGNGQVLEWPASRSAT
jgi:hypothetical protein